VFVGGSGVEVGVAAGAEVGGKGAGVGGAGGAVEGTGVGPGVGSESAVAHPVRSSTPRANHVTRGTCVLAAMLGLQEWLLSF